MRNHRVHARARQIVLRKRGHAKTALVMKRLDRPARQQWEGELVDVRLAGIRHHGHARAVEKVANLDPFDRVIKPVLRHWLVAPCPPYLNGIEHWPARNTEIDASRGSSRALESHNANELVESVAGRRVYDFAAGFAVHQMGNRAVRGTKFKMVVRILKRDDSRIPDGNGCTVGLSDGLEKRNSRGRKVDCGNAVSPHPLNGKHLTGRQIFDCACAFGIAKLWNVD